MEKVKILKGKKYFLLNIKKVSKLSFNITFSNEEHKIIKFKNVMIDELNGNYLFIFNNLFHRIWYLYNFKLKQFVNDKPYNFQIEKILDVKNVYKYFVVNTEKWFNLIKPNGKFLYKDWFFKNIETNFWITDKYFFVNKGFDDMNVLKEDWSLFFKKNIGLNKNNSSFKAVDDNYFLLIENLKNYKLYNVSTWKLVKTFNNCRINLVKVGNHNLLKIKNKKNIKVYFIKENKLLNLNNSFFSSNEYLGDYNEKELRLFDIKNNLKEYTFYFNSDIKKVKPTFSNLLEIVDKNNKIHYIFNKKLLKINKKITDFLNLNNLIFINYSDYKKEIYDVYDSKFNKIFDKVNLLKVNNNRLKKNFIFFQKNSKTYLTDKYGKIHLSFDWIILNNFYDKDFLFVTFLWKHSEVYVIYLKINKVDDNNFKVKEKKIIKIKGELKTKKILAENGNYDYIIYLENDNKLYFFIDWKFVNNGAEVDLRKPIIKLRNKILFYYKNKLVELSSDGYKINNYLKIEKDRIGYRKLALVKTIKNSIGTNLIKYKLFETKNNLFIK